MIVPLCVPPQVVLAFKGVLLEIEKAIAEVDVSKGAGFVKDGSYLYHFLQRWNIVKATYLSVLELLEKVPPPHTHNVLAALVCLV